MALVVDKVHGDTFRVVAMISGALSRLSGVIEQDVVINRLYTTSDTVSINVTIAGAKYLISMQDRLGDYTVTCVRGGVLKRITVTHSELTEGTFIGL